MRTVVSILLAALLAGALIFALLTVGGEARGGDGADHPAPYQAAREDPADARIEPAAEIAAAGTAGGARDRVVELPPKLSTHRPDEPAWSPPDLEVEKPGWRADEGNVARAYYGNGNLEYEGGRIQDEHRNWLLDGPWKAWHENGQLHESGAYRRNKEIGFWQWWYENGEKMAEGRFVDGKRDGFWLYWHENGALMTECTYQDGKAHWLWSQYHPDGFKTAQGTFQDGELAGEWIVWKEDGTLNLDGTGSYDEGEKVGE